MLILGVDVETTGLDVKKDEIIELGCVLWETDTNSEKVIWNNFVYNIKYKRVPEEITKLTGIEEMDLKRWGVEPANAFRRFCALADHAEYIVAHNGTNFDRPIMESNFKKTGVSFPDKPWIDTVVDIPFAEHIKTRKLIHLAAEHGFINPSAHRAYSDVISMLKILSQYNIKLVIERSHEPNVTVTALCAKPWEDPAPAGEKQTDKAKARGYRFDGSSKTWVKTCKASEAELEKEHGEFAVKI